MRPRHPVFLPAIIVLSLMVCAPAVAADHTEPPRIGILLYHSLNDVPGGEPSVLVGLRDVGLVDGKTATILVRQAEGNPERLPQLAAELSGTNIAPHSGGVLGVKSQAKLANVRTTSAASRSGPCC